MPAQGEAQCFPRKWYFTREEIEDHSPSRKDGISQEEESHLRKLYCSYLQEFGMELQVPQMTIATAMMLCHRFYMRQSHSKNHWQTIATGSMFLASKVEETPRRLNDVTVVSYKLIYKWDPSAPRRIKQKEVYDEQKELILQGERLLLTTVAFDLNIEHPYKPLVSAMKKLEISHKELAKVAWNFVNDWLRTTLCLQYKPHYVAAGSLFLAAKMQKVKLPTGKEGVWWMQFDVSPKHLEEAIQCMVRTLEQGQKKVITTANGRISNSQAVTGKSVSSGPESCVSNGSSVAKDSSRGAFAQAGGAPRLGMSKSNNMQLSGEVNCTVKGSMHRQTSDSGSVNSTIEGGCSEPINRESCQDLTSNAKDICSKIDVNRIRGTLIRRRSDKVTKKKSVEVMEDEMLDGETWIERELESGIVLSSADPSKRRRLKI